MQRSPISTHVLDTARGRPAAGVSVTLEIEDKSTWKSVAQGVTDQDGRITNLLPVDKPLVCGIYRLTFDIAGYQSRSAAEGQGSKRETNGDGPGGFYPQIPIVFQVKSATEHYHVPLLLSPYGYSTYRGS